MLGRVPLALVATLLFACGGTGSGPLATDQSSRHDGERSDAARIESPRSDGSRPRDSSESGDASRDLSGADVGECATPLCAGMCCETGDMCCTLIMPGGGIGHTCGRLCM